MVLCATVCCEWFVRRRERKPEKTWRFQFHLSTAALMMVGASVLLWLNCVPRQISWMTKGSVVYGWPFGAYYPQETWFQQNTNTFWLVGSGIAWSGALADITVGLLATGLLGFMCERVIHRALCRSSSR
jgi:hypothetical protein